MTTEEVLLQTSSGETLGYNGNHDYIFTETLQEVNVKDRIVRMYQDVTADGLVSSAFAFTWRDSSRFLCVKDDKLQVEQIQDDNPLKDRIYLFVWHNSGDAKCLVPLNKPKYFICKEDMNILLGTEDDSPLPLKITKV
ncbi:hypothetical protein COCON_G00148110 [Conger conger]|uniref:Uncharacterized protein n=1 Tax=Conger conger TaxID=82655 RepID=A0A9Q1HUL2_CONCO|nr:hypothetical protein COCON_G00148110 [Conger conger]